MQMSVFDFTVAGNDGQPVDLAAYRGQVLLIVNTASKCGFTPQYQGLQKLHDSYGEQGLVVLAFPCNQFAGQEPGDDAEIRNFCSLNYDVSFPLMKKVDVNGTKADPLWKFLKSEQGGLLGSNIKWNFTKFLVNRDGKVVSRHGPQTRPEALEAEIRALL
jgi:glutathione peroxidase